MNQLIKAEVADREVRSINYQMKVARFPAHRDLAGFTFADSAVNEALVRTLHRCRFLDQTENIVLIGGPGTGKTHMETGNDSYRFKNSTINRKKEGKSSKTT